MKKTVVLSTSILILSALMMVSGCSRFGAKRVATNESLVIPPSLRQPNSAQQTTQASRRKVTAKKAVYQSNKNYYVVVGTYPDQGKALDTFVRLSSIGLPGATMESRSTKSGKVLHMVRLGPYHKQDDIDRVKDSLTSDGLSQFKVVQN